MRGIVWTTAAPESAAPARDRAHHALPFCNVRARRHRHRRSQHARKEFSTVVRPGNRCEARLASSLATSGAARPCVSQTAATKCQPTLLTTTPYLRSFSWADRRAAPPLHSLFFLLSSLFSRLFLLSSFFSLVFCLSSLSQRKGREQRQKRVLGRLGELLERCVGLLGALWPLLVSLGTP